MVATTNALKRVLGVGFGLAMAFGGTVGVGILRLPSTLAAALGDARLILLCWVLGGIYALLGAMAVSELSAMMPEAGGFYVYSRRAFGGGVAFVVALCDWLNQIAALAYGALTASAFLGQLSSTAAEAPRAVAIGFLAMFCALHWVGIRLSGFLTRLISASVGVMLLAVVIGCFVAVPSAAPEAAGIAAPVLPVLSIAALVAALRAVFLAYDGWYSPIYMAEESTSPTSTMPRALIGGTLLIAAIYILINVAILRVLPMQQLAASTLPAADAARLVLPKGGGTVVTVISLLTLMSLINAVLLMTPRIILAVGRSGFLGSKAAAVSESGTPRTALAATTLIGALLILRGSFEQITNIAAVLFLLVYATTYLALIVLRRREPQTPRPYRAFGFPWTTLIVLFGCLALWVGAVIDDVRSGLYAALLVAACAPVYFMLKWWRGRHPADQPI
jgi:basic amino acid/polyamine antiporter, APA family